MRNLFVLTMLIFTFVQATAQQVYQWRGPNRNGKYNESGLLSQWPETGPQLLWSVTGLGDGFAAPCIADNKLIINGVIGGISYVFGHDTNGKLLWKTPNGKEFTGTGYAANFPGARSTPTVIGNLVYATSGLGRIACLELETGKEKWSVEMQSGLNGYLNEFGYSESLVADEKHIYCFQGGKQSNIAALDRLTGKTVWTSKALGDTTHFCSPVLINHGSYKMFVTVSRRWIFGVDCKNGELLWKYPLAYKYDGDHVNTPVFESPYLYFVAGDENGYGAIKLELAADGKGVREIWANRKIRNSFSGFVLADNKLFVTTENKNLNALDVKTGEISVKIRAPYGGILMADNKFIVYGNNGEVSLINYSSGKLSEGGSFKVTRGGKEHFAYPVVSSGILYIRHGDVLMAYKIK